MVSSYPILASIDGGLDLFFEALKIKAVCCFSGLSLVYEDFSKWLLQTVSNTTSTFIFENKIRYTIR